MSQSSVALSVSRRISVTLFITQSLYGACMISSFTLIPILGSQLSGGESLAGLPLTLAFMARALCAYPFGWIMDRFGRRPGMSLGYLSVVIGSALCVWAIDTVSFIGFCIGVLVAGCGRAATEQARFIGAEVYPLEKRAKVIGMIVFAGTVGAVGGPMLVAPTGGLMERFGLPPFAGPFFMAVILCGLAVLMVQAFLRPDPLILAGKQASGHEKTSSPSDARSIREIFANPTVKYATTAMVIGQLVMTLLMVITPLHMNHHEHSTQSISLVIMAHAMGMFGLSSLTGRLVIRYGSENVIRQGVIILAISSIMAPISPQFIPLAVALFLLGLGWNFCFIAGSNLLSNALSPQEKGRVQGANEMLISISASVSSISTGVAFGQGGILFVGIIGLLASIFLGVYSLIFARRTKDGTVARQTA